MDKLLLSGVQLLCLLMDDYSLQDKTIILIVRRTCCMTTLVRERDIWPDNIRHLSASSREWQQEGRA